MTEIRQPSKLTACTVYESSAQLRRVASIDTMPAGEVSVVFEDLPQNGLDKDSVQVAVRYDETQKQQPAGTAAASTNEGVALCSLRGVSFKTEQVDDPQDAPTEERSALIDKIRDIKHEIEDLEDRLAAVDEDSNFGKACLKAALDKNARPEEENDDVLGSVDTFKNMLESAAQQDTDTLKQHRDLEKLIAERKKHLAAAQADLANRGGHYRVSHKSVVIVVLKAEQELKNVDVRISYVVNTAAWHAEYDVRYDPDKGEAIVTYNAVVKSTGCETWENVELTVSTARPQISGKPKELTPWRVRVAQPVIHHARDNIRRSTRSRECSRVAMSGRAMAGEADEGLEEDAEDIDLSGFVASQAAAPPARVSEGAISMAFTIDHPTTVTNDNKPVRVTLIGDINVKSAVTYVTRPRISELVFARLRATNLSEYTLLPGSALVFCGQQFVAKTEIARCSPGDSFDVSLGVDNDVTVKYARLKNERGEGGGFFSGKKVTYNVSTKITVKSQKPFPVDIHVEDQVPISQHGDITVTMVDPPKPDEKTDKAAYEKFREGVLEFDLKRFGGERDIEIKFNVEHPAGFEMTGL